MPPIKKRFVIIAFLGFSVFSILYSPAQPYPAQANFYRFQVGNVEVVALSDGTIPVDVHKLFPKTEPKTLNKIIQAYYLSNPVETSINTYLIKSGSQLILVDAGSGDLFGPEHGGQLLSSLRAIGHRPEQITDVLLTHIHVDHSGGLVKQGKSVFSNATIHVNQKDIDFWLAHVQPSASDAGVITVNRPAFLAVKPYLEAGKVKTFLGETKLFPGISAVDFAGHTPGHSVFVLESNGEKLVFWGDLIHMAAIQLNGPAFINDYDFDQARAVTQRQKAYREASQDGYLIAADHISFPGIGRVRSKGSTFDWIPVPYSAFNRTDH